MSRPKSVHQRQAEHNTWQSGLDAEAITVSPVVFDQPTRGVYVGTTGNITVTMASGNSVSFNNVQNGTFLPIAIKALTAATASNVVAVW